MRRRFPCRRSSAVWLPVFSIALALIATAQETPPPESPPPEWPDRSVEISFLPPPLEGTLSMGIYDSNGKLVRVLHRESNLDDFTIGEDALSTTWDGKNDAGENLPPGKYSARGFSVADLKIEGVASFFNDWVTDEKSPRILQLATVWWQADGLRIAATVQGDRKATFTYDAERGLQAAGEEPNPQKCDKRETISNVEQVITCDEGKDKTLWVLDGLKGGSSPVVKQLSEAGALLRELVIPSNEPQPIDLAASRRDEKIFLIEKNNSIQRLRGLTLTGTKTENGKPVSDWKVDFEKKIIAHKDFTIENGRPVLAAEGTKPPPEKVSVKLQPNPLVSDKRVNVDLSAGFDATGSFLQTADGLPLRTISETPHLARVVVIPHDGKSLGVFQDDDAVVEQFRVSGVDKMMSFDCGDFELK